MIFRFSIWILAIQIINRVLPDLLLTISSLCYPNYCIFSRKVHTFSQKWRSKSEICQETSAETKSGDTGLSNGTSHTWKLLRSKENDGFENQHVNQNLWFIALLSMLSLVSLLSIPQYMNRCMWVSCVANHVNPEKIQISNFKSTVLCVAREFASGTGTVGKPCVSSFVF